MSALAVGVVLSAARASSQDAGATVGASVGVTNMASRTELTFAGAGGYRFNRIIGIEIDVTAVPTLKSAFPTNASSPIVIQGTATTPSIPSSVLIYPGPTYENPNGRAVIFTNNVRVDLPTTMAVLTPYFVAGGGVASVRRSADLTFRYPLPLAEARAIGLPIIQRVSTSETALALTLGGGLAVRVSSHVSVDGDLRFFRLLGSDDSNAGRFGVGVRYRF